MLIASGFASTSKANQLMGGKKGKFVLMKFLGVISCAGVIACFVAFCFRTNFFFTCFAPVTLI